ncbi:MAG: phage recombination protein Bet [Puniceicoccales bacterium]|jgi:phage recombination protein Bet|nr:phage recombination protein Bet [Puniceicoccales bacterium]
MAAVQNSLAAKTDKAIEYESNGTVIKLSPSIVRNYLVNGNGNVTDQEVVMFLNLCKAQRLNPFIKEAYLIKYGSQPATIVTGKEVFTKRARRNKDYGGMQAGVIVRKENGELENRVGSLVLEDEQLVGGWAKVFVKGDDVPTEMTVSFEEYCLKKDGKPASNWAVKPGTMIRKVALVQALREAFPDDFQGMYDQDEVMMETALSSDPNEIEPSAVQDAYQQDFPEYQPDDFPEDEPDPLE